MNIKIKSLLQLLLSSPRRFPVEAALGIVFFFIAVLNLEKTEWNVVCDDILVLFVPLVALSFWLQRFNRWVYFASFFLVIPLLLYDIKPLLQTYNYGFGFTYVLAAILIVVGNRRMDNRTFVAHAIHVAIQMFFGLLLAGILHMAAVAIVASIFYIFGLSYRIFYDYITYFIWLVLAPQICCTLIRQDEDDCNEPAKIIQIILNFILSPAVIIYTVILYIYFIKIVFQWELPKGGVAMMVMGFIAVAQAGRMSQAVLSKRYYDWFYRHFTLIAIPPLILYWVGSIYRIRIYSFTESRFYLIVAGVLMTFFVLMLYKERTRRYQLMALILGAAIILFTYIPGISAKSIGLRCQKERLAEFFDELQLLDAKTGKLIKNIDLKSIKKDSLLVDKYSDLCSVIDYVKEEIGTEEFIKNYGEWNHKGYNFYYEKPIKNNEIRYIWAKITKQVELGDYCILLPEQDFECNYTDGVVTVVRLSGDVVVEYPIDSILRQDTTLLHNPENFLSYKNDSMMLVLTDGLTIEDSSVSSVYSKRFMLFKKPD